MIGGTWKLSVMKKAVFVQCDLHSGCKLELFEANDDPQVIKKG